MRYVGYAVVAGLSGGLVVVGSVLGMAAVALRNGAWDLDDDDWVVNATIGTD